MNQNQLITWLIFVFFFTMPLYAADNSDDFKEKPIVTNETIKTIVSENQKNVTPSNTVLLNGSVSVKWPNGDSYEGEYINGKRTGQGLYIWANGDRYEGEFIEGKLHGKGIYTWNGTRYEGEYNDNKRHGKGIYIWTNGDRYEGDFEKGQRHGQGKLTWTEGEIYEGDFVNGQRTGKGVYIFSTGNRYEGHFENGKRTGKGILISSDSLQTIECNENSYIIKELEFKEGKLISASPEDKNQE